MRRCLETVFCMLWIITGCSLDTMFESDESFWTTVVAFVVAVLVAFVLWGNRDGGPKDF